MKKRILLCCAFIATLILGIGMLVFADDSVNGFYSDYNSSLATPFYQTESVELNLPLTYEATVYFPDDFGILDRGGVIFGNYTDSGVTCVNFEIYYNGVPRLYIVDGNGTTYDFKFSSVDVYTGEPVHLAISLDPTTDKGYCYVNGELKQTLSKTCPDSFTLPSSSYVLGGDLRSGNGQYFKGKIQGLAMYYDTRTATEVQADYQANEIDTDNLLASYDFSDVEHWGQLAAYSPVAGMNLPFANTNDNPDYWLSEGTSPSEYDYSFAVVGDTQSLTKYYPDKLDRLYDWIITNKSSRKIEYVVGLGDLVDSYANDLDEWDRVKEQFKKMDGIVPYSIVRGNHDDLDTFNQYFTVSEFQNTFTGNYGDTMTNTYHKFTVNGLNYMILCLDTINEQDEDMIKWANDLVASNPDYNVIVTTHIYMTPNGTYAGNNYGGYTGQELWDKLVSRHKNIVLMLCGHEPTDNITVQHAVGRNGNVVPQILIDPQTTDKTLGGVGLVSMFGFSDGGSKLTIDYYATARSAYFKKQNQMELSLNVVQPDGTIKGYVTKQYSSADEIDRDENEVPYYDDNYLFAGWYEDAECTTSLQEYTPNCYAKFVDREVLTVALQLQAGTTNGSTESAVKFLTSVDSTNYQKVGFTVDIKQDGVSVFGGEGKDVPTNTVYETLDGYTKDGVTPYLPSDIFAEASKYFAGYELTDITNGGAEYAITNEFAWTFVITPYWTTYDGVTVKGLTKTFEINDFLYEAEIDELNSEDVLKHVWYPTLEGALDAAQGVKDAADSITILSDVELNGTLGVTQTLELKGREGVDLTITRGIETASDTEDDYTYHMLQNKTTSADDVVSIQAGIDAYGHGSLTFDSTPIKDGVATVEALACNVIRNDDDDAENTEKNTTIGSLKIGKQVRIQNHKGKSSNTNGANSTIYNAGKATLYCDLLDNDSTTVGSPIVNANKAELTIAGGNYLGNKGNLSDKAGVLYNYGGTVKILGGTFNANKGGYAGVIYNAYGSKLTISGGQFAGNVANTNTSTDTSNGAGVVRNQKAELTITGGTFNYNYGSYSGVVHNYTNDTTKATVTITGGTFTNNYAQNKEGTGVIRNENANSSITIDGGTFMGNIGGANKSGVLYNLAGTAEITGGKFDSNHSGRGGVIYNGSAATLTITSGEFVNNYATANGGGVIENNKSSLTIAGTYGSRVIMKNNYWKPTITTTLNTGGGAILHSNSAPTLIIGGCVIEDNNGVGIDGATEVADITVASAACGDVTFTDGTFKGIFQANGAGWTSNVVLQDGSSTTTIANADITKATYLYLNWTSKTLSTEAPKDIEYGPIIK